MAVTATTSTASRIAMRSLERVQSPVRAHRLAKVLLGLLLVSLVAMGALPWQQTSRGSGRVIAYHPTERPQTIEAPLYGRVVNWGENIAEGVHVRKGQMILEIADNDPLRAERLAEQVEASQQKLAFATDKSNSYKSQIEEYREARTVIVESYEKLVVVAEQKLEAARQDLEAAVAAEWQLELDRQRQNTLAKEGIVARLKAQEATAKHDQAIAKRKACVSYVAAAEGELHAKEAELQAKTREANTKLQEAEAKHQHALGEEALARKELAEMRGKAAQFGQRRVESPRDGLLLRLFVSDNAQMLKEGDPLFTVVPETEDRAVEMWIDGNDVPLVEIGREVRLQFEGWPAVQFAGWPSVAVGTFGGQVVAIDGTDDGKGKFRVLVRPRDTDQWPTGRYLRQGARVNGWVMLNQVSLGYELWRQLNGFPPVISKDEPKTDSDSKDKKKVKLPK
jgi:multidrug resistance efflux pump